MATITTTASVSPSTGAPSVFPEPLLAALYESALDSSSLLASRHAIRVEGAEFELPKFLLLGQRGGGRPIRLALFAGFDAHGLETTMALARLLLQYEISPALARDYALFAYPVVNFGIGQNPPQPLSRFERRYALDRSDADVQFFKSELSQWAFDGLISLRFDPLASGFFAVTRSEVITQEVALPALQAIAGQLPLRANPLTVRPADQPSRLADIAYGKLTVPPGSRPTPFEIEVFAPGQIEGEQRVTGLFLIVQEILRHYRRLISHAQHL